MQAEHVTRPRSWEEEAADRQALEDANWIFDVMGGLGAVAKWSMKEVIVEGGSYIVTAIGEKIVEALTSDDAEEDVGEDSRPSADGVNPPDAGVPGGVPNDDDIELTPGDGWEADASGGTTVQVLRVVGGGYTDPGRDGTTGDVGVATATLTFRGGYTDPNPEGDDRASGTLDVYGLLERGGFTDPNPLSVTVAAGMMTFRIG